MFVQVVVTVVTFMHVRQRIYDTWRVAHIRSRLVFRDSMRRLRNAAERDRRVSSAMVSVLPPGIDVRKLQRSHSRDKSGRAFIRFTKPSFFRFTYPVYLSDLACSHQTLSDISLDRSEVKSDKLLDVNAALGLKHVGSGKHVCIITLNSPRLLCLCAFALKKR